MTNQLKQTYEWCCNEYRRKLCEMWNFNFEDSWWVSEEIGSELCIADSPWGLDMKLIRYIVENDIGFEPFMEWWNFVESEIHDGHCPPRINFYSWHKGARPEISTK